MNRIQEMYTSALTKLRLLLVKSTSCDASSTPSVQQTGGEVTTIHDAGLANQHQLAHANQPMSAEESNLAAAALQGARTQHIVMGTEGEEMVMAEELLDVDGNEVVLATDENGMPVHIVHEQPQLQVCESEEVVVDDGVQGLLPGEQVDTSIMDMALIAADIGSSDSRQQQKTSRSPKSSQSGSKNSLNKPNLNESGEEEIVITNGVISRQSSRRSAQQSVSEESIIVNVVDSESDTRMVSATSNDNVHSPTGTEPFADESAVVEDRQTSVVSDGSVLQSSPGKEQQLVAQALLNLAAHNTEDTEHDHEHEHEQYDAHNPNAQHFACEEVVVSDEQHLVGDADEIVVDNALEHINNISMFSDEGSTALNNQEMHAQPLIHGKKASIEIRPGQYDSMEDVRREPTAKREPESLVASYDEEDYSHTEQQASGLEAAATSLINDVMTNQPQSLVEAYSSEESVMQPPQSPSLRQRASGSRHSSQTSVHAQQLAQQAIGMAQMGSLSSSSHSVQSMSDGTPVVDEVDYDKVTVHDSVVIR